MNYLFRGKRKDNQIAKLREALEEIQEYQMGYVELARTSEVWKIADQALNQEQ